MSAWAAAPFLQSFDTLLLTKTSGYPPEVFIFSRERQRRKRKSASQRRCKTDTNNVAFLCGKKLLSYRKHCPCESRKALHTQVPEDRCENISMFASVRASPAEEAVSLRKNLCTDRTCFANRKQEALFFFYTVHDALLFLSQREKEEGGAKSRI